MKEYFIEIDGLRIRYLESKRLDVTVSIEESGPNPKNKSDAEKPKDIRHILFIHGLGSSGDRWLDIPDAISLLGFNTISLDLPGFGGSDKRDDIDYNITSFVRVIKSVMHRTAIDDGKTCVVGHSLGGYVAAQLATDHSELVKKLVLVDSSGLLDGPTPLLKEYLEVAMKPSRDSVRKLFERLVAEPLRIPDLLVDGFIFRLEQPNAKLAFREAFDDSTTTRLSTDRLKLIGDRNISTLIIWGEEDKLIPLEYCIRFKNAIKNSQTAIIKDAGHAPFAEKPAIFTELLHEFLRP